MYGLEILIVSAIVKRNNPTTRQGVSLDRITMLPP